MLQQWTEVVFSTSNQSGHLPSDRCLTVSHQIIHGRWSRPKQHCSDRLFSPASPALANMLKGLRRGSAPGQAAFVTGASFLENQGDKVAIKSSQMLCRLRAVNSFLPFGGSATSRWTEVRDYKRHIHCPILDLFDSSGSGDSRLSWLALTNGSKMLQNVLDYLPNNRVPHRPVVDEIYSSPSGPPPGFYVDELRDVSKILVSVDCRLELIQKEFKQQIPAIELWQKQTGERMNRTLLDMLAKASIDHPEDWDVYLDRALLAYRTSVHCTTGATPSRVLFDRELRLPVDLMYGVPTDAQVRSAGGVRAAPAQRFGAGVRGGPKESLLEAWKDRKAYGPVYESGDQVWMQLPTKTKLGAYWDGPYTSSNLFLNSSKESSLVCPAGGSLPASPAIRRNPSPNEKQGAGDSSHLGTPMASFPGQAPIVTGRYLEQALSDAHEME
ncbi:hypothetical protein T4A_13301 [Trichinella pseudospiralis]|uniref:Integrase catalytic domain-containing protein n=1 Tax=Trichinella pseudospiralis TaxID=6337 RepID=A0A0V1F2R5_TRIPS|nr:hypothetical protein T4A_13301 [Trichinella pseudospiralis]